jgi:hypothetical protein
MPSSLRECLSCGNFASSCPMFCSRYKNRLWLAEGPKLTISLTYMIILPKAAISLLTFEEVF